MDRDERSAHTGSKMLHTSTQSDLGVNGLVEKSNALAVDLDGTTSTQHHTTGEGGPLGVKSHLTAAGQLLHHAKKRGKKGGGGLKKNTGH